MHINEDNKSEIFEETKEVNSLDYDSKDTKFIKSHLPFFKAFKMGASSIKTKPIRLIFTIILIVAALVAFGVTSTLMLYDASYSVSESLKDSYYDYEQIKKKYKFDEIYHEYDYVNDVDNAGRSYTGYKPTYFYQKDIDELNSKQKNKYTGVIDFELSFYDFESQGNYYKYNKLNGLIDVDEDYLKDNNFAVIKGKYPSASNEIAITKYMYNCFANSSSDVKSYDDLIGKTVHGTISDSGSSGEYNELIVSGIIDVGNVPSCFDKLNDSSLKSNSYEAIELSNNFEHYMNSSFHLLGFVSKDFYNDYVGKYGYNAGTLYKEIVKAEARGISLTDNLEYVGLPSKSTSTYYYNSNIINRFCNNFTFKDLDGNDISYVSPKGNECYISKSRYDSYLRSVKKAKDYTVKEILERSYLIPELADIDTIDYYKLLNKIDLTNEESQKLYSLFDYNDKFLPVYNLYLTYRSIYINQLKQENPNYENDEDLLKKYNRVLELIKLIDEETSAKTFNYDSYLNELDEIYKDGIIERYYIKEAADYKYHYGDLDSTKRNKLYKLYSKLNTVEDYNELKDYLDSINVSYETYDKNKVIKEIPELRYFYKTYNFLSGEFKIIGIYDNHSYEYGEVILNDEFIKEYAYVDVGSSNYTERKTDYETIDEYKYNTLITKTDFNQDDVKLMLKDYGSYKYEMTNSIYDDISIFINMINTIKNVLLIAGIVVAIFASLMLLNFISTSIANKTKEIGILRAVGARGADLFKIFFCESSIISIICIILSVIGSILTCKSINESMANAANLVLLDFNIINILMIFIGAMVITAIGTFIPVYIASKKQPVDSIRTL